MTRNEQIAKSYRSGQSMRAIGEEHGITRERVRQILKSKGVASRSQGTVYPDSPVSPRRLKYKRRRKVARRALENGASAAEARRLSGLSPTTIALEARADGIPVLEMLRRRSTSSGMVERTARLWNLGLTAKSIAVIHRTTPRTVRTWIHRSRTGPTYRVRAEYRHRGYE